MHWILVFKSKTIQLWLMDSNLMRHTCFFYMTNTAFALLRNSDTLKMKVEIPSSGNSIYKQRHVRRYFRWVRKNGLLFDSNKTHKKFLYFVVLFRSLWGPLWRLHDLEIFEQKLFPLAIILWQNETGFFSSEVFYRVEQCTLNCLKKRQRTFSTKITVSDLFVY